MQKSWLQNITTIFLMILNMTHCLFNIILNCIGPNWLIVVSTTMSIWFGQMDVHLDSSQGRLGITLQGCFTSVINILNKLFLWLWIFIYSCCCGAFIYVIQWLHILIKNQRFHALTAWLSNGVLILWEWSWKRCAWWADVVLKQEIWKE